MGRTSLVGAPSPGLKKKGSIVTCELQLTRQKQSLSYILQKRKGEDIVCLHVLIIYVGPFRFSDFPVLSS